MAAYMLTWEDFENIRATFLKADKDRNGVISKDEYVNSAFEQLVESGAEISDEDSLAIRNMLDIDRDGTITFYEFLQMMAEFKYNTQNTENGLKSMFKAFDTNGDGVLSKEELLRVWKVMFNPNPEEAEAEIEEVMSECDINKDGKISYDEFVKGVIPKLKK